MSTWSTVMPKDCPFCHKANKPVKVNYADYMRWQGGTLIQNAMPYLTADERELLMTGICDDCFPKES